MRNLKRQLNGELLVINSNAGFYSSALLKLFSLAMIVNAGGCAKYLSWQEEVDVGEEKPILIEQRVKKIRYGEAFASRWTWKESSITVIDEKRINWSPSGLKPLVIGKIGAQYFVISLYVECDPWLADGKPNSPYRIEEFDGKRWSLAAREKFETPLPANINLDNGGMAYVKVSDKTKKGAVSAPFGGYDPGYVGRVINCEPQGGG